MRALAKPTLFGEARTTMTLAVPLIIGQLSQMAMAVIDTVMVGKLGTVELAALSFASAVIGIPLIIGIGLMTAVSVLGAQARGAGDQAKALSVCHSGLYLGLGAGALLAAVTWLCLPLLKYLNQPPDVLALTPPYTTIVLVSLIPAFASMGLKNFSDSQNQLWPGFFIFLAGVLLNIPLNQLFIHGWGIVPGMGLTGAGWATLVCRIFILAGMIVWLGKSQALSGWVPRSMLRLPSNLRRQIASLAKLGVPTSAHLLAEGGAFSIAGFLIGAFGERALAAHQIAVTTSSGAFMIPLGVALALTVRMGQSATSSTVEEKRRIAIGGWLIVLLTASLACVTFLLFGRQISSFYVSDPDVIAVAVPLLVIVAMLQFVDSIQVASTGLLRGLSDVTAPAWIAFACYWVCGISSGYLLAHHTPLGAKGIWWGLVIGLAAASVALTYRFWKLSARKTPVHEPTADSI